MRTISKLRKGGTGSSPKTALGGGKWTRMSVVAAMLGAFAVSPLASPSAPVSALAPIDCAGPTIVMTRDRAVVLVDTTEGAGYPETPIISSSLKELPDTFVIPDFFDGNQVGVRDGGGSIVFTGQAAGGNYIYDFDLTLPDNDPNKLKVVDINATGVSGAIDLKSGVYFFGDYKKDPNDAQVTTIKLFPYSKGQTSVPTTDFVTVRLPEAIGNNGDITFDTDGNLFLLTSSDASWTLFNVSAEGVDLLERLGTTVTATEIASGSTAPGGGETGGQALNGIAYGQAGNLFTSGSKYFRKFDSEGNLIEDVLKIGTDTGSCVNPPTIRLFKDLPNGRVGPDDQFELTLTAPSNEFSATTFGTEKGLQTETDGSGVNEFIGPVVVGRDKMITISEAAAGTTDLAKYTTTVKCINETKNEEVPVTGSGTTYQFKTPLGKNGEPEANISCVFTNDAAAGITVQKDLPDGRTSPTDQFELSLTPGDAPNAVTTGTASGVQAEKVTLAPATPGETYTFTETASGSTNLDFYDTTWACIDTANNNAPLADGSGASGTVTVPDGGVLPNILCTFTNKAKTSDLVVTKSVDPEDGSTVQANQTLTYTVSLINNGGAPAVVDLVDNIAGVLDDADITVQPSVTSGSALTVSAVADGEFSIKGNLPPGASSDITYEVKVKPDGSRGDNVLLNFVLKPGTPPPPICVPGDPFCTENPVPELKISKSVDPQDGSIVQEGQVLTYTMTFDNSAGKSAVDIDNVDNLAGVLDDADVVEDPKLATGSGLTVSPITNGEFAITGTLAAGQVATVTYKAQVKPLAQRGDSILLNFLLPPTTPPPPICVPGDPLCTENKVPGLGISKSVEPEDGSTVEPSQELTYTVTLTNTGAAPAVVNKVDDLSGILDDADVTEAPKLATGSGLEVSAIANGQFTIKGNLEPGATATVTMKVVVKADAAGDDVLLNFVLEPGTPPPPICVPGDPLCTENPVSRLKVVKDVDPADGSVVQVGQKLVYTLTFTNSGKGDANVDKVDNLAGILDDAEVTEVPTLATGTGLVVSAIADGQFTVTGTLAAGETATVTMAVVVKADADRGDSILLNFVLPPGKPPPPDCVEGDPECTDNRVPGLGASKSVDPEDGSSVVPDQVLTYTLTFTNTGAAAGTIDRIDDVSGVVDDATITEAPKLASGDGLTVSAIENDKFTIKGDVQPGATATVTMKVVVKADGERGDNVLLNFLLKPGEEKPPVCIEGDPNCTENPVPDISLVKEAASVTDVDGSNSNTAGDIINYTFTVTNTGGDVLTDIELLDPKLSNQPLTCPKDTLEVEEVMTCTATYTITVDDADAGEVVNTATVTGTDPDGVKVSDDDDAVVDVQPEVEVVTTTTTPPTSRPIPPKAGSSGAASFFGFAIVLVTLGGGLVSLSRISRRRLS